MTVCASAEHDAGRTIDERTLERLCQDLDGNKSAVEGFVSTFIRLWPSRFSRVDGAARRADVTELLDSTLSIRSSSRMLGAVRLDEVAGDVERCGRAGNIAQVRVLVPELAATGQQTLAALKRLIASRH